MRRRRPSRAMGAGRGEAGGGRGQSFATKIHIITGVSLLDGGRELTASVTVPSASRLLGFSAAFVSFPGRSHISAVLRQSRPDLPQPLLRESTSPQPSVFPVPFLCAHGVAGEQVSPEPSSAREPCTGCAAIRFLGSDPRLLVHVRLLPGGRSRLLPDDCLRNHKLPSSW